MRLFADDLSEEDKNPSVCASAKFGQVNNLKYK